MLLVDAGTAYTKVLRSGRLEIYTSDRVPLEKTADLVTGHNAGNWRATPVNELIALGWGGFRMIESPDFNLLDIGCRDIKLVKFRNRKYSGCGWNDSCGSLSGFTLELLGRYFEIDFDRLEPSGDPLNFTCGIFGIAEMFDRIYAGARASDAVAALVTGLALRAFEFADAPEKLYLSGGLCGNRTFLNSFPCEVVPLGRGVLLRGLQEMLDPLEEK
jgi:activator of 2-hydroxyglutaryl-CoA dehydratase